MIYKCYILRFDNIIYIYIYYTYYKYILYIIYNIYLYIILSYYIYIYIYICIYTYRTIIKGLGASKKLISRLVSTYSRFQGINLK